MGLGWKYSLQHCPEKGLRDRILWGLNSNEFLFEIQTKIWTLALLFLATEMKAL